MSDYERNDNHHCSTVSVENPDVDDHTPYRAAAGVSGPGIQNTVILQIESSCLDTVIGRDYTIRAVGESHFTGPARRRSIVVAVDPERHNWSVFYMAQDRIELRYKTSI